MKIRIQAVPIEDKPVLRNLLELYSHDFSEFDGADVDDCGLYGYPYYFDDYWTEEGRHPFFIRVDGRLAGFVMVRDSTNTGFAHEIAEFFIMRKYRRSGVGKNVAWRIFDMLPGTWRVYEVEENKPAQAFWRRVISEYADGDYHEIEIPDLHGPVQEFESRRPPER